jgi:hypothetical protein
VARKKSQALEREEVTDHSEEEEQPSEMILPEGNVFNIGTKKNITETINDPLSMDNHHKFSKFKK